MTNDQNQTCPECGSRELECNIYTCFSYISPDLVFRHSENCCKLALLHGEGKSKMERLQLLVECAKALGFDGAKATYNDIDAEHCVDSLTELVDIDTPPYFVEASFGVWCCDDPIFVIHHTLNADTQESKVLVFDTRADAEGEGDKNENRKT